jgi:hypothetical protein
VGIPQKPKGNRGPDQQDHRGKPEAGLDAGALAGRLGAGARGADDDRRERHRCGGEGAAGQAVRREQSRPIPAPLD